MDEFPKEMKGAQKAVPSVALARLGLTVTWLGAAFPFWSSQAESSCPVLLRISQTQIRESHPVMMYRRRLPSGFI